MELRNPFPGIRSFRQSDAENFFGRAHLTIELFEKLERKRFVSVVGASGCGKSSLINAGLLPMVLNQHWNVVIARPQDNPINNLAIELKKLEFNVSTEVTLSNISEKPEFSQSGDNSLGELRMIWENMIPITLNLTSQGVVDTYQQSNSDKKLLIIIDQFEELFQYKTRGISERDNAIKFVNLLMEAAHQHDLPIHIIIVMRADFLGYCSQFKGLPELINNGQFLIPRLTRDQYRQAITSPLDKYNIRIASNIVSQLLNDIEDDPDQLPILQHALMLTFEEWKRNGGPDNNLIDSNHYDAVGGMAKSIDAHCNIILDELKVDHLGNQTKIIFQRLTDINLEGIEIRSPATVKDLMKLTNLDFYAVAKILDTFRCDGRNFLSPSIEKTLFPEEIIDLSHECIMRKWFLLQNWIKEEETNRRDLLKLLEHHKNFIAEERQHLKGLTLSNYLNWTHYKNASNPTTLHWASRYTSDFLSAINFITKSKERNLRIERNKRISRRALIYGIPSFLIFLIAYLIYKDVSHRENKLSIETKNLQAQHEILMKQENRLKLQSDSIKILKVSTDPKEAAKVLKENDDLSKENDEMKGVITDYIFKNTSLKEKYDSILNASIQQESNSKTLKSLIELQQMKSISNFDSTLAVNILEKQKAIDGLTAELRQLQKNYADSISYQRRLVSNEKGLKDYFAKQFAEELKKNKTLLEEFEKKFRADFNDQNIDPILASSINNYIKEHRDKLGTILGRISEQHNITLYTNYEGAKERLNEFSSLLRTNGFDGAIFHQTINRAFFNNSGITILAKDQKIMDLLKTFIKETKYRNVSILEDLSNKHLVIPPSSLNKTIIVLDY